jgi:hypothetical protein
VVDMSDDGDILLVQHWVGGLARRDERDGLALVLASGTAKVLIVVALLVYRRCVLT